jgi:hypothetical protein
MPSTLKHTSMGTCPECGGPALGLDVKYSFFRTTENGTYGPAPLDEMPHSAAHEETIERFADKDVITVQPCGDSFPRYRHAAWLAEVDARLEVERAAAAQRKRDRGPEGLIERIEAAIEASGPFVHADDLRAAIEGWRNQP